MNYKFSKRSIKNLKECHRDLQLIAWTAIQFIDFAVIEGHRPEKEQNEAFDKGNSKVRWPNGKHNKIPAMAFDAIPYVHGKFAGWENKEAFIFLGGHIMAVAQMLYVEARISHQLRWGGDWQSDKDLNNSSFVDSPHYELI